VTEPKVVKDDVEAVIKAVAAVYTRSPVLEPAEALAAIQTLNARRDAEIERLKALLTYADNLLIDIADCPDPTEPAADGGITVFMVIQHDAKFLRTKIARAVIAP
jgi:hypothetical protein